MFPLAGKIPYEFLGPEKKSHGHRDATTDREQIAAWWNELPKANIGLATGKDAGILVVDMDVPNGYFGLKELQEQYGSLPPTRTVHTASGGLHYYFAYPKDDATYPSTVGLADKIGVPRFTNQQLRHTAILKMIDAEVPYIAIAEHIGNKRIEPFRKFGAYLAQRRQEALDSMEHLLGNHTNGNV